MSESEIQEKTVKPSIWPVELWRENRELFKAEVRHTFFFGVPIGSLEGFHRLLDLSKLPIEEVGLLNKLHFYSLFCGLVIFVASFLIKLVCWELQGVRR